MGYDKDSADHAGPNDRMYSAIGRATMAWQVVEDALCDVFNRILICSISGTMRAAKPGSALLTGGVFYRVTSFRTQLDMIGDLVEQKGGDETLKKEWKAIRRSVEKIKKSRNTLAHSTVWGNEEEGITSVGPTVFVDQRMKEDPTMSIGDIRRAEQSFKQAAERISAYAKEVNHYLVQSDI